MNMLKDAYNGALIMKEMINNTIKETTCSHDWEPWQEWKAVYHQWQMMKATEQRYCKKCRKWEVR